MNPFAETLTAPRCDELLRAARERRFNRRVDLLNRIWWATQENELAALNAKVDCGERLTNAERCRRQGIIFNHAGNPNGFCVI